VVRVQVGNEVEIHGPTIGVSPARGRVTRINPAGFTKVSSLGVEEQRVRVLVRFEEEDLDRLLRERNLGIGYRVRARIFTARKNDAKVVPRSALFRSPSGGWQCFVVTAGRIALTDVSVGLMNDRFVEVVEGLAEGDRVVVAPEASLTDGLRVRSVEQPAAL
jgi:HlyD family secretion protein